MLMFSDFQWFWFLILWALKGTTFVLGYWDSWRCAEWEQSRPYRVRNSARWFMGRSKLQNFSPYYQASSHFEVPKMVKITIKAHHYFDIFWPMAWQRTGLNLSNNSSSQPLESLEEASFSWTQDNPRGVLPETPSSSVGPEVRTGNAMLANRDTEVVVCCAPVIGEPIRLTLDVESMRKGQLPRYAFASRICQGLAGAGLKFSILCCSLSV